MEVFVGRATEVATIRAAIAAGTRTVVLTGPAGVGKTRLAHAVGGEVVADDLHRCAPERLAALVERARAGTGPVVVATARDVPSAALLDALAALAALPTAVVLPVPGLSTGAVSTLAEALLGEPVGLRAAVRLRHRTGGRPYWVEQLAHAVRAAGDPRPGIDTVALPALAVAGLVAPVDAVAGRIGADARALAEAVAVLGDRAELDLVVEVLGRRGDALPALRAFLDAGLLTDTDGRLAFRDPLTREAVAGRVPTVVRREWHDRAYHRCLRDGADDAVRAGHAAGAGRWADATAAAIRAAAAALADGSPEAALRSAELALRAAEPAQAVRAHELAARAAHAAGFLDDATAHARAWCAGAPDDAEAHCLLASLRWSAGDTVGQWAELDAALAAAGSGPAGGRPSTMEGSDRTLATVLAARVTALMRAERNAEAIAEADRVIAVAEQCGAAAVRRSALVDKGTALCIAGDPAAGLPVLAQAADECEAADDRDTLGRALNNAFWPGLAGLTTAEQWEHFDRTYRRVRTLGLANVAGKLARQAADLARHTGRWAPGWAAVTARLPEEGDPAERATLAAKAALLAFDAGRPDDAVPFAEKAAAGALGMDQFWVRAYIALLDVALTAHRFPPAATVRALARFRTAMTLAELAKRPQRIWEAARYALDSGVSPAAVRAFTAAALPGGFPSGHAERADLAFAERAGDAAAAVAAGAALMATPWIDGVGAVERADVLVRLGRAHLRLGAAAAALALADEAAELLAEWPGPLAAAAQALRTATGADEPRLTDRERDVHALVVAGLPNRAIAERLGLAPRTIAVHVTRILAKTGCASRTELTARSLLAERQPGGVERLPQPGQGVRPDTG